MFKRFTLGMAAGYVLGARAGEKRYQQITSLAERALELPAVGRVVESGRDFANDKGRDLIDTLKTRAFDTFDRTFSHSQEDGEEEAEGDEEDAYEDEDDADEEEDEGFDDEGADEEGADEEGADVRSEDDHGGEDDEEEDDDEDDRDRDDDSVEASGGSDESQDRDEGDEADDEGDEPDNESSANGRGRARDNGDQQPSDARRRRPAPDRRGRRERRGGLSGIAAAALERGRVG